MRAFIDNLTVAKKSMLPLLLMAAVAIGLFIYLILNMISMNSGFSALLDNEVKAELLTTQVNGSLDTIFKRRLSVHR